MDIPEVDWCGRDTGWQSLILKASIGDEEHAKECSNLVGNDWDYRRDLVWSLKDSAGLLVAAMVTQKVTCDVTDRVKIHILNCAGKGFKEWGLKTLPVVEQYARDCGAYSVTLTGRKGWARVLPGYVRNSDGILERVL